MSKLLYSASILALVTSSQAFSAVAKQVGPPPCDRSLTPASMTEEEQAKLSRDGLVERTVPYGDGTFFVSYLFSAANFDAELAMGLYTSCGEQAGADGLGDFITKSEMKSPETANPFTVYYEQSGQFGFSGGEYEVQNTVGRDGQSYLMNSRLVWSSSSHFSPKIADGYVRMVPMGPNKVFVIACNYMEPNSLPFPSGFSHGKYVSMAYERLATSGANLLRWVSRVSEDSDKSEQYREHLKTLLANQRRK